MDITSENFLESLPLIEKSIRSADFISFDTEFSGLAIGYDDERNDYDTVEDQYQKIKHCCSRMNAFQIGISTFKWDHSRSCYITRAFNFYVFPTSTVMEKRNMQFNTSNINFLMQNNFDFNKLFKFGINYQRLCDIQLVQQRVNRQFNFTGGQRQNDRNHTSLGSQSTKSLKEYISSVINFVEIAKKNPGNPAYKIKTLDIESYALKKQLAKELYDLYKDQNIIFTEYKKGSSSFNVKIQQWRNNQQRNPSQYHKYVESKFEPVKENKIDRIINKKDKAEILWEDQEVMAVRADKPEAKVHFLVFSKNKRGLTSMEKATEHHEKQLGHLMAVVAKVAKQQGLEDGYRTVINNGESAGQDVDHLTVHVLGGQQLSWPPFSETQQVKKQGEIKNEVKKNPEEEKNSEQKAEVQSLNSQFQNLNVNNEDEDAAREQEHRLNMVQREMGFTLVVEMIIVANQINQDQPIPIIGHNMMYDIIYLYNQCIGPLPDSYDEFVKEWHQRFPVTVDTKLLAFQADCFSKTPLGIVFEKCTNDKKFKDILAVKFDLQRGFGNYAGTELLSHYHEAAYDAYMTGVVFAKTLKFKEIDEIYAKKRMSNNIKRNKKGAKHTDMQEFTQTFNRPEDLKNTKVNMDHQFFRTWKNKVMMNQFAGCACYHMDPAKPDQAALELEERNKQAIHIIFQDGFAHDLTAENLASQFSAFGDFQIIKDTLTSIILNFYHMDKSLIHDQTPASFIKTMQEPQNMEKYKIKAISTLQEAPKFKAHNHTE